MRRLIEGVPGVCWWRPKRHGPAAASRSRAHVGLLWNWRAAWVGYHYSTHHKRLCVNVVPFLTIWYTKPGGMLP